MTICICVLFIRNEYRDTRRESLHSCARSHIVFIHILSILCREMKLIVIACYPNNSHFYFFFSWYWCFSIIIISLFAFHLFILAYINNRRISDWRHVVSSLLWIIVQKRADTSTDRLGITTIDIYPFVYFDFSSCNKREKPFHQKHIHNRERNSSNQIFYD